MLAILLLTLIAAALGGLLALLQQRLPGDEDSLVEKVNALLPQTQCGQCQYPGCRPYAEAMVVQTAAINQCPPGGEATIEALAELLGQTALPLNPEYGESKPPLLAWIREQDCIGCTLCIQACPVDAIVGASKWMHTVIADECTGCELCLPPCPVDCIELVEPAQDFPRC